jgi:Coenzyme PQQ synthesis protein D (PqqD)
MSGARRDENPAHEIGQSLGSCLLRTGWRSARISEQELGTRQRPARGRPQRSAAAHRIAKMGASSIAANEVYVGVADVELAAFPGELVVFQPDSGLLHRLSSGPAAVWLLVDGKTSVAAIVGEFAVVFGVTHDLARTATNDALEQLTKARLVYRTTDASARPAANGTNES